MSNRTTKTRIADVFRSDLAFTLRGHPLIFVLFCLSLFLLFYNLGGPALFEPDEGRNAEVAREVLLVQDWEIPHYNFTPRLDKPILFYWLIALSYKLFGVSEWSARLPSALMGLACLLLTLLFAQKSLGSREALWSGLILTTTVAFFLLSRTVVPDMTLTFFVTLSLCAFFRGTQTEHRRTRGMLHLLMYSAMGAGFLVKGPIGLALPAMVISSYLLLAQRWSLVRDMHLIRGVSLLVIVVAPWYGWVELRHPGYLHYFLIEENLLRFLTHRFNRSEPWYYFIPVIAVGFLPWTVLLPSTVRDLWKWPANCETLFLICWTVVPFLFFSLSASKLPHYILPIYPPLSLLVGKIAAERLHQDPSGKKTWPLWLPALTLTLLLVFSILIVFWNRLLPDELRGPIRKTFQGTQASLVLELLLALILSALAVWSRSWSKQSSLYFVSSIGFILFAVFIQPILDATSLSRSSKELAGESAGFIRTEDQIALYDAYLSSLPFYLRIDQPLWVVWSGDKSKVMGSSYVAQKQPPPAPGYQKALLTYGEFSKHWKEPGRRLFVFVHEKEAHRLDKQGVIFSKRVLQVGDILLISNQ